MMVPQSIPAASFRFHGQPPLTQSMGSTNSSEAATMATLTGRPLDVCTATQEVWIMQALLKTTTTEARLLTREPLMLLSRSPWRRSC
jgi:hypothetical protein